MADDFLAHKYDFKHLVRTILGSQTYQRSSATNATNSADRMNFSHALQRRLSAEQLLDAISWVTGVDEELRSGPKGLRAGQVPFDGTTTKFLALFGRPDKRSSPCECVRSADPTLPQLLHLLNGDTVGRKLRAEDGKLRKLLKEKPEDTELIEAIYLSVLNRLPRARECTLALEYLRAGADRAQRAEDLMWALIAGPEFLFNH